MECLRSSLEEALLLAQSRAREAEDVLGNYDARMEVCSPSPSPSFSA